MLLRSSLIPKAYQLHIEVKELMENVELRSGQEVQDATDRVDENEDTKVR